MSWPSTHMTLVRQIQDPRNDRAWNELVDLYAPVLYRLCRRQRLQDADAADVVQNVLLRVCRAAETYDPDRGRFRSWLVTIASREIHRYRNRPCGIATGATGDVAEIEIARELTAAWAVEFQTHLFQCALRKVQEETDEFSWNVFEQVWLKDCKVLDVAHRCGRNIQWVYRTKQQVLDRLRRKVKALEADAALLSYIEGK